MADVAKRLKALAGTVASFAADLFDGRMGIHTDGPAGGPQWAVRVAGVWQYAARGLVDGWADNKGYKVNGVTAIDAARAASFTACTVDGKAAVTRAPVTREASVSPMTLSGAPSTPLIVNCVDANMPAYGFAGSGAAESLSYAIDFNHNRIAEEPAIVHVHWLPNTTGAGDVGFKLYYQWTEAGAVWQPATLFPTVAVAAGGVQWADKRTDFSIPGTGKSYNSRLLVRLIRDASDPLDTYAGHAVLAAVGCHYQADLGQP